MANTNINKCSCGGTFQTTNLMDDIHGEKHCDKCGRLFTDRCKDVIIQSQIDNDIEPTPDLGCCSQCGGRYPVAMCPTEQEGDWESGYYDVHVCPYCEDGGCIDDYDYTTERFYEWEEWRTQIQ